MIPYLTIVRIVGPYLIAALIGGAVVGKIQQVRINHVKADLQISKQELSVCQEANKANQSTIESLKKEVKTAYSVCDSRFKIKDKTLRNIQRIDSIPLRHVAEDKPKGAANDEAKDPSGTPDALLDELNRLYPGKTDRKN